MGFLACLSIPRPLMLGGRTYLARALRVQDYAALEALAAATLGDPLDGLDPADHAALRAAHAAAEDWPPEWGSEAVRRATFGTAAGRALLLALALRDAPERPDPADLDAADWDRLQRIAFGVDVRGALDHLVWEAAGIAVPAGGAGRGRGVPWTEAIAETCTLLHKTPAEVGTMTLAEIALVRSGGKPADRDITPPAGWSDERIERELSAPLEAFWAEGADARAATASGP